MNVSASLATDFPSAHSITPVSERPVCLLVEDSEFASKQIMRLLTASQMKFEIISTESIGAAREVLYRKKVDILLLENELRDGLGLVLAREIRQTSKLADIPIIMISGDTSDTLKTTALETGCNDFLSKEGLSSELLQSSVQTALKKSASLDQSSTDSEQDISNLLQLHLRDSVIELNTSVLRISRLSRKLQRSDDPDQGPSARVIAAEIQAVSEDLHRRLNAMLAENAIKRV